MIKINLLSVERKVAKAGFTLPEGQKIILGCSALLIATALFIGWRYWALDQQSVKLDQDISAAQLEAVRLRSIITQVQQFEQRKIQLQQRVSLIEQLRKDQAVPVHMLDQISLALPSMLWLTELKEAATDPNEVLINGKCTSLTALTDFVANLEASGFFKRSVEIVNSQTEVSPTPPNELVTFTIRVQFQRPGETPLAAGAASGSKQG